MTEHMLLGDLARYHRDYRWNWGLVHKLVYRRYGPDFTVPVLKRLYRAMK